MRLGANWVMGMQSKDGGFAAFDVDNNSEWLNHAPFADVEAVDRSDLRGFNRPRARDDGGGRLQRQTIRWRGARSRGSRAIRRPTARGGADGVSAISMALSRRCRVCARLASTSNEPWIGRAVALAQVGAECGRRMG